MISLTSIREISGFVIVRGSHQIINPTAEITTKLLSSKNNKKGEDPILRDEWARDIASMGGDPSFLPDGFSDEDAWYDDAVEEDEEATMPSMSLMGVAGMPSVMNAVGRYGGNSDGNDEEEGGSEEDTDDGAFEWDGVEDEDAYYDD